MPYSIYPLLNIGPLKNTSVILQLVDMPKAYPKGILEDLLVQFNEMIFPIEFYMLDI